MERQKKVALINDMTGYGRCSLTVEIPIISAMGIQACPVPTAVLSAHTGFPSYVLEDYTDKMAPYIQNWVDLKLQFDGIGTGFLGSVEQISLVEEFFSLFKRKETLVVVDPVMGDDGKRYTSYTDEMCQEMKRLLPYADVITPNLTEACVLLDVNYEEALLFQERELESMAKGLCEKGPTEVVLTGIHGDNGVGNFVYSSSLGSQLLWSEKIGISRAGTGDVFTSVVIGSLLQGISLAKAVQRGMDFICASLVYTEKQQLAWYEGICFEPFLGMVMDKE